METHSVLYEHIGKHVDELDKNLCYHILLVDSRLRKIIIQSNNFNYVVLIKTTEKYTLNVSFNNPHTFFVSDNRIYLSCMDELNMYLEDLDILNSKAKKLLHRGIMMKVKLDNYDDILISYDTYTYKRLINMIPKGVNMHEIHLKLYKSDKLNHVLQYIDDSYTDIVKRINISMSTMSREILDIYHMTRNQSNSILYNILPHSYRQILYQLHSDYINQKNDIDKSEFDNREKMSISVDNVYTKLKELETDILMELYRDRDQLSENIKNCNEIIKNPIKTCTNTKIQTKLMSLNKKV
jgi:hypothetical protein